MRTLSFVTAAALAGTLLVACSRSAPAGRVCTQIGCDSGLAVVVEGTPPGAFRVEARASGEAPRVEECRSARDCGRIFFTGFLPAEVTVEVIAGEATSSRTVLPAYETLTPNGPDCPPTCRQARVTVPWPGGVG